MRWVMQKCWTCSKATNSGCSWSRDFIPIEGWDAEEVERRWSLPGRKIYKDKGYSIKECPEYEEDKHEEDKHE